MPSSPVPAVDPVFSAVAKAIYGDDIDPREVLEKADAVLSPAEKKAKAERAMALTGLGATAFSALGHAHSISATNAENRARVKDLTGQEPVSRIKRPKFMGPKKVKPPKEPGAERLGRMIRVKPRTAAGIIGGSMLALHGVDAVGDVVNARAQVKALKAHSPKKQGQPVAKALRLRPLNVIPDKVPSLRAKRVKVTPLVGSPRTKAGVFQPVGKGLRSTFDGARASVRAVKETAENVASTTRSGDAAAKKVVALIPSRRTAALAAGGTVGLLAGATYAGTRAGTYAGTRPARPKRDKVAKAGYDDVTWTGMISKVDEDKRQVFGWASVSRINGQDVIDLQGDVVPIEEIEKSAYKYVIESRKGGDMHRRVKKFDDGTVPHHTADMIESFVVTPEKLSKMGLPDDALPHGWWVGYKVNDDEQWQLVKSGARAGFSIHGSGTRTPMSKAASARQRKLTPEQHKDLRNNALRIAGYGTGVAAAGHMVNGHAVERARDMAAGHVAHTPSRRASILGEAAVGVTARRAGTIAAVGGLGFAGYHAAKKGEARRGEKRLAGLSKRVPAGIPIRKKPKKVVLKPLGDVKQKVVGELHRYAPQIDTLTRFVARGPHVPFAKSADGPKLRERVRQAVHPPPVRVDDVKSSAVQSMGYQPQTRRLSIVMRSRPDRPYDYRMDPGVAREALEAPSKGRHYATAVRGKEKRAKRYTVADRARLFMDPDISKRRSGRARAATLRAAGITGSQIRRGGA
jgi:hypothetical protein